MKVVILSAGQGRRLMPLTADRPKCALDVGGRTMLEVQLGEIAQCDVDEVVVVTGFRSDIVDSIVAGVESIPVRTFHNPFYAHSDNLGTCWIAREEMREPFIILNGDTLFEAAVMRRLLDDDRGFPITLVTDVKDTYDADDMKVVIEDGVLRHVGKQLPLDSVNAESIGMMAFRGEGPDLFRAKVSSLMAGEDGLRRWYLSAIDELADGGHVGACSIAGLSWCEVDDRDDLDQAQNVVADWYAETREFAT